MNRSTAVLTYLALAMALLCAGVGQAAQSSLGAAGAVYVVRTGYYGALFPDIGGVDAGNSVLALEITRPGAQTFRLVVPGSEGSDVESQPSILYEESSDSVFLLWESRLNFIHSSLNLIAYREGGWSEVIELSGNTFFSKQDPQFSITRNSYTVRDEHGLLIERQQTVLHLLWWEEGSSEDRVNYTPVILEEGSYLGWNPVYRLSDFDTSEPGGSEPARSLVRSPKIQPGEDEQTVVVGFANPFSGRLTSLEIEVVPGGLSYLAEEARAHIIHVGSRSQTDLLSIAEEARAHIIHVGTRFHPAMVDFLAKEVHAYVLLSGTQYSSDLVGLADAARAHIIHVGSKLNRESLKRAQEELPSFLLHLQTGTPGSSPGSHFIQIRRVSDRPAPDIGEGSVSLYLSRAGRNLTVAWDEEASVQYRESQGDDWSEVFSLDLEPGLNREQAHRILAERSLVR